MNVIKSPHLAHNYHNQVCIIAQSVDFIQNSFSLTNLVYHTNIPYFLSGYAVTSH